MQEEVSLIRQMWKTQITPVKTLRPFSNWFNEENGEQTKTGTSLVDAILPDAILPDAVLPGPLVPMYLSLIIKSLYWWLQYTTTRGQRLTGLRSQHEGFVLETKSSMK